MLGLAPNPLESETDQSQRDLWMAIDAPTSSIPFPASSSSSGEQTRLTGRQKGRKGTLSNAFSFIFTPTLLGHSALVTGEDTEGWRVDQAGCGRTVRLSFITGFP